MLVPAQEANATDAKDVAHLEFPHGRGHASALLPSNSRHNRVFGDIKHVVVTPTTMQCTCEAFMRYFQCEHVVDAESLDFTCRSRNRDFSLLPQQRKCGRPLGSGALARKSS